MKWLIPELVMGWYLNYSIPLNPLRAKLLFYVQRRNNFHLWAKNLYFWISVGFVFNSRFWHFIPNNFCMGFIEKNSAGYTRLSSSTESYLTDISVYSFNGNFNPYKLLWFGAGHSKNQSTLLNIVYIWSIKQKGAVTK